MPEGDTIHNAANRIRPLLQGLIPSEILTPQPRHRHDRWPQRLAGRTVRSVDAYGKHLFIRFEGDLTIHSHLRMNGWWGTYRRGERWRRPVHTAWLVFRTEEYEVVQFKGPLLELMTESRIRFDPRLSQLGPDILAERFDEERFLRRLRADDQTRTIADALLDQRNLAGIGNIWKAEACWAAQVDPWRSLAELADEEVAGAVRAIRPRMQTSALEGHQGMTLYVYERVSQPCVRCGTKIGAKGQGDGNRTTFWCRGCQR